MTKTSEYVMKTLVAAGREHDGVEQCHHWSLSLGSLHLALSQEGRKLISVMAQKFSLFLLFDVIALFLLTWHNT